MLGVGGGVVMVPAMNLLMRVPVKAAAGTSSFMVGITSVATAFVFYAKDKIDPTIVVPAIIGVFVGSQLGSRLTRRLRAQSLASLATLLAGTAVSGLSSALGYRGSLQVVNDIAPDDRRAEVVSSYFLACFFGNSVPVIGVGILAAAAGFFPASLIFAAVIAALALFAIAVAMRQAPSALS